MRRESPFILKTKSLNVAAAIVILPAERESVFLTPYEWKELCSFGQMQRFEFGCYATLSMFILGLEPTISDNPTEEACCHV